MPKEPSTPPRREPPLDRLYRLLFDHYGPQHWWPAEGPFEMMVGAILTQNTAWRNVARAIDGLRSAGLLDPAALLDADEARLEQLIRPAGYFRQKAARLRRLAAFVRAQGGVERMRAVDGARMRRMLLALNGVGPETADSILLYALDHPFFVIDAYTVRLLSRLGWVAPTVGYAPLQALFQRGLPRDVALFQEFHALIVAHAKAYCRKRAHCAGCPLVGPLACEEGARHQATSAG
ncbi:MAG: endonuclease III domain-containing protein [Zetaproteobacteria bacterium]|nr:MAG: endonuclease III domain-containing protein [Zetaproteobacteria bacterium]